jgi:AraC-like DNA-binding protein
MQEPTPILEFNKFEVNVPFEIHTMEWIEQNRKEQNNKPHRHNYYAIVWVKKGKGTHLLDLNRMEITDNTIYCISPGQVHLLSVEGAVEGYVISFTADFIGMDSENLSLVFESGIFNAFGHGSVIRAGEDIKADLEETAARMMKEYGNYFLLRGEILRGYLKILLIYITRKFDGNKKEAVNSKNYDTVRNFFQLLDKYYASKKQVSDYAKELALTPNHLNELIKKITGHPASYHLRQRVVLEAKRLVSYTNLSMKEIAYRLGFDDPTHFSHYFKNASGQNFSDYKSTIKTD